MTEGSGRGAILIIESEGKIFFGMKAALDAARLVVHRAPSLAEAVAFLQRERPGLILFDLDLTEQEQVFKACRLIKQVPSCSGTPLFLVAHPRDAGRVRPETAGVDGVLEKPIGPRSFLRWLRERPSILAGLSLLTTEPSQSALSAGRDVPASPASSPPPTAPVSAPGGASAPVSGGAPPSVGRDVPASPASSPPPTAPVSAPGGASAPVSGGAPPSVGRDVPAAPVSSPPSPAPVAAPGGAAVASPPAPAAGEMGEHVHQGGGIVLLMDGGDEELYQGLAGPLAELGWELDRSASLSEGAARLKNVTPSVLLIDMDLPEMDGDQACALLKRIPECASLSMILLSPRPAEELAERLKASGADGYLRKPFSAEELVEYLRERNLVGEAGTVGSVSGTVVSATTDAEMSSPESSVDGGTPETVIECAESPGSTFPASASSGAPVVMEEPGIGVGMGHRDELPSESDPSGNDDDGPPILEDLPPIDLDDELGDLPVVMLDPSALVMDDAGGVIVDESVAVNPAERIEHHLRNGSIESRIETCLALGRSRNKEGVPALISILEEDDREIMAEACWALGEIGDPSAVPVLCRMLERRELLVRSRAMEALGKIGEERAVVHIIACLSDAPDELKIPIVRALAAIGGENAEKALAVLVNDVSTRVSDEAEAALARMRSAGD